MNATIGEQLANPEPTEQFFVERPRHCYRVWMKDGYASLHDAESEAIAKSAAIKLATESTSGLAMSAADRRKAVTVDYAEQLD